MYSIGINNVGLEGTGLVQKANLDTQLYFFLHLHDQKLIAEPQKQEIAQNCSCDALTGPNFAKTLTANMGTNFYLDPNLAHNFK